ncbi:MAG: anti-sigma factor family protein [Bacteroidota bacterium]|jgi:hypothetical protein
MNIPDIIKRIRHSLGLQKELPQETVIGIMRVLETMPDEEITCEDLYARLDEYVEREMDQKDAAQIMPILREHLDVCPECCEEYEALLDVLNKSSKEKKL